MQLCIDRFGGLVWSLARRFCLRQSDAEDAVQEIFLDVWKSSHRYDPKLASEATFIAMIARRRLIDRRRRDSRAPAMRPISGDTAEVIQIDAALGEASEDATIAAQAMLTLRPEQQRVLRLSIYQGLSHERIAEATGLPLGTVKTHVRRGLIRLREVVQSGGRLLTGGQGADSAQLGGAK